MTTSYQRRQAIKFQDAIGKVVDQYLLEHMDPAVVKSVLLDEANEVFARLSELERKK